MDKCKILFLAANPSGTSPLALDEESRAITQKIRLADGRDSLELITRWAVRPDDLLDNLNQHRPYVVHFSGHGTAEQEIILLDETRKAIPVPAAALRQLFKTLKDNIRVVVLNACYSKPQAEAIVQVIDCAIGMKQDIGDEAAITFAASFYGAIGYGRSVLEAFEQGKTALMLNGIPEEDTPTLLVRTGVDPATLFLIARAPAEPARRAPAGRTPAAENAGAADVPEDESDEDERGDVEEEGGAAATEALALHQVLPGSWQVHIQLGFVAVEMRAELLPTGQFRGQLMKPTGITAVEGQWQADPISRQIGLQGFETNGYQTGPYVALIQVTAFDAQRITGLGNMGEQVAWQRLGPPAAPAFAPGAPPARKRAKGGSRS